MKKDEQSRKPLQGSMAFTELASTDPGRTKRFLEEAFGWRFNSVQFPMGEILTHQEPAGNAVGIRSVQPAETPITMNYVRVDDLKAAEEKIRSLSAEIVLPKTDIPKMGSFFWFKIPGGPIMACWQDSPENLEHRAASR